MNRSQLVVFFVLALLATSCDPDFLGNIPEDVAVSSQNTLNIRLTDDPVDLDEVNIDLEQIIIKGPSGFAELTLGTHAGIYNLLDYQNGLDTLIASAEDLPFAQIREIRLVLGSENSVVKDGVSYDLKVPSGSQSGLKIKVCLDLSLTEHVYDLILDFDAGASIHQTGNGKFILKPVIRILNPDAKCGGQDDNDYEEEDDDEDHENEEPATVLEWLKENYPDYDYDPYLGTFCDEDVYIVKAVKAESVYYIYFDKDGQFLQEGTLIANADLPDVVQVEVETTFSGYTLQEGPTYELIGPDGKVCYQLRVDGGGNAILDLVYEENGTLVCQNEVEEENEDEEDDSEDEEFFPIDNVPADILVYITTNYPGFTFTAIREMLCDGTEVYLLSGKNGSAGILLYYSLEWELIQEAHWFDTKNLPELVVSGVSQGYADYKIMNNHTWEIIRADGEIWYRIYLKKNNSGKKIYVIYTADGTFVCQES